MGRPCRVSSGRATDQDVGNDREKSSRSRNCSCTLFGIIKPGTKGLKTKMAVKLVDKGAAPGLPGRESVKPEVTVEAMSLISELTIDRIFGEAGTIHSLRFCRIDRQPPPAGGANIQVQLNGLSGDSTISTCIVHSSVLASLATWPRGLREHQNGWLARQIRIALTNSLESGHIFHLSGSFHDDDNPANLNERKRGNYQNLPRGTNDFGKE